MGKYDRFKGIIPTHKEALQELVREYGHLDRKALLQKFVELKEKKERLTDELKEIERRFTAINELLVDRFEAEDLTQIKTPDLGTFGTRTNVYVSAKDKKKLHDWLRENNYGDLIREEIHHKVLNSLFTDILQNASLPEDAGVAVFLKTGISHKSN